jgi:SAM-dependent methyltransferase
VSDTRPWEANAAFWDAHMGDGGNEFHRLLVRPPVERLLGDVAGQRVLDLACGNGIFSLRLRELGARVVAADVSQSMLAHARRRSASLEPPVDFRLCDATDAAALLALGEGAFDAVVCNMTLMDIPEIAPLASAVPRLLADGGRFVFSTCHPSFNRLGMRFVAPSERQPEAGVTVTRYLTPAIGDGVAIEGQPVEQLYFDRPLSLLLEPFFAAGLVMDGCEETAYPAGGARGTAERMEWRHVPEIPAVLVARLRHGARGA